MVSPNSLLVSVDGPLGSGKTPFAEALAQRLRELHGSAVLTTALSRTDLGEFVRHAQFGLRGMPLAYLAAADRYLQWDSIILPALTSGSFVVVDRYVPTAVALDGFGAAQGPDRIHSLYKDLAIPATSLIVTAPLRSRETKLQGKGLLTNYDSWFMRMVDEQACYEGAVEYLSGVGWRFQFLNMEEASLDASVNTTAERLMSLLG